VISSILDCFLRICHFYEGDGRDLEKFDFSTILKLGKLENDLLNYSAVDLLAHASQFRIVATFILNSDLVGPFLNTIFDRGNFISKQRAVSLYNNIIPRDDIPLRIKMMTNSIFDTVMDILRGMRSRKVISRVLKNIKFALVKSELCPAEQIELLTFLRERTSVFEEILERGGNEKNSGLCTRILSLLDETE
jgi:hypothetical protein